MDIFQAIILGILQGLGEFLPISSTAHLILAPYFFGWQDPGLAFDVALHVGTLFAVIAFFWRDWLDIFKNTSNSFFKTKYETQNESYNSRLLLFLALASVPGALIGLMLEDYVEKGFRHPLLIAAALSIAGAILYAADRWASHRKTIETMSIKDALIIGISQAVALIPGVSRSGATMTAGLLCGLDRSGAARFSFLLSTPIIFGAAVVKVPTLLNEGMNLPVILGIIVAAISGFIAIKYMLQFIQRVGYAPFFWYRIALSALIMAVYMFR